MIVSAISEWLKKRAGQNDEIPQIDPFPKPNTPRPNAPRPPAPVSSQRQPPPPSRQSQPPPLSSPRPAGKTAPTPPLDWRAEVRRLKEEMARRAQAGNEGPPVKTQRGPSPPPAPAPAATLKNPLQTAAPGRLAKLSESAAAHERASSLAGEVGQRLAAVDQMTEQHRAGSPRSRHTASAELQQAVALARRPQGARQAMALSIIFGKPKALEEWSG